MRPADFRAYVEALAQGEIGSSEAALARALNKQQVRRCSKAWDTFARNCVEQPMRSHPVLRQLPPTDSLPPVA